MLKRAALVCCAVSSLLPLCAQSPPKIDPSSQPAANQLAAIARTIKGCPRAISSEKKWGNKPAEIERWYIGPPQNVVWDVLPSTSVRSPYVGYIEFSLPENYWVPDEVKDKFMRSDAGSSAELAHLIGPGSMKHRYEFDLRPDGLELTRMLHGNKTELFDDSPDETCWQNAARNSATSSTTAPPPTGSSQAETPVPISKSGTAFLAACDNDDKLVRNACTLWVEGFVYGLITAGTDAISEDGTIKIIGSVCLPKSASTGQELSLILTYLKNHSREADRVTAMLALAGLREAFPCKQ